MFRRLRAYGPGALVPLAWGFIAAAHFDLVSEHAVFVAHVVMTALLAGFAVTGWSEMTDRVLRLWRTIIAVGVPVTLSGAIGLGLFDGATVLLAISLYGWMVVPAIGLLYTGRHVDDGAIAHWIGGALSLLGAMVYAAGVAIELGTTGTIGGLSLVGIGQTIGILTAIYRR